MLCMVNPYDIERTADAIRYALEMEPEERTARMQRLRKVVREQNIYRWAGNLIGDLCDVRLEIPRGAKAANRVAAGIPELFYLLKRNRAGLATAIPL